MRLGPKALPYHLADDVLSLFLAGLVNAAILIMAAAAFYSRGIAVATIDKAYLTLEPLFGRMASVVFGVALLAAGISSSITGTLAGQSIMESLTDFRLSPLLRRIITRVINVVPIVIAILRCSACCCPSRSSPSSCSPQRKTSWERCGTGRSPRRFRPFLRLSY